jgi:RNA recognition motif-containing protein
MAYTAKGESAGQATIEFKNPDDSTKAYQNYNGRLIDQSSWRSFRTRIIGF